MLTPQQEKSRCGDIKTISGILVVGLFAFLFYNAAPFFETVHTINQVAKVGPVIVKEAANAFSEYEREMKQREADAKRYLSLTPTKVAADSMGVKLFWKFENTSEHEYRTAMWDCTAFFNDEPVGSHMVIHHHLPAGRPTYRSDSFAFREYDPSFSRTDPSAFRFDCQLNPSMSYWEKVKE